MPVACHELLECILGMASVIMLLIIVGKCCCEPEGERKNVSDDDTDRT